jgi:prolyl oligopeptidase
MLRYHKLPPGSSWIGEYGDPGDPDHPKDPRPESEAVRRAIQAYSPYQNVREGAHYPEILFFTGNDDRVHRSHARKMAAKLQGFGQPALYYEFKVGGHSTSATPQMAGHREAMFYTFFWNTLAASEP